MKNLNEKSKNLSKKWPYPAKTIYDDEKEILEYVLTGLSIRHKIPLIIIVPENGYGRLITSVDERHWLPKFCLYVQDEVSGGYKRCLNSNIKNCLKLINGRNLSLPLELECHMGLKNIYMPIYIDRYNVACCASGKICFKDDIEKIKKNIKQFINQKESSDIHQHNLYTYLSEIIIEKDAIDTIKRNVESSTTLISTLLTQKYKAKKLNVIKSNRERIETKFSSIIDRDPKSWANQNSIKIIIEEVCNYLGTKYLAIFLAGKPHKTVLDLIMHYGIDSISKGDVHFNCKKAKFKQFSIEKWDYSTNSAKVMVGIKGYKSSTFNDISYFLPFIFAGYHGAVALGPFKRNVDVNNEKEFLNYLCYRIGLNICGMGVLKTLHDKEKEKDNTVALSAHMARHGLQNIWAEMDEIFYQLEQKTPEILEIKRASQKIDLSMRAFKRRLDAALDNPMAITGILEDVEPDHLKCDAISVQGLLDLCVQKHEDRAQQQGRIIIVHETSLELMPGVYVDTDMMRLALDNLLENAIKYSGKNRKIRIKGKTIGIGEKVEITITNLGLEIAKNEIPMIFKTGFRSTAVKKQSEIGGHGLGLGQVKKIVELHSGRIDVENKKIGKGDWNYLTTFKVTLPSIIYSSLRRQHES